MATEKYLIRKEYHLTDVTNLIENRLGSLDGDKNWEITIRPARKTRSLSQNNYYWACIVTPLAAKFGYTTQEMHLELRAMFLTEYRLCFDGQHRPITIQTSDPGFTTKDAERYYEKIRHWALMEHSFTIMLPNEHD